MAKRFTDTNKWRNEWFRSLPVKAKLAWIYLCDECDFTGIWKADFGLASFQLDFDVKAQDLVTWFGNKVFFFDTDKVLIVPFFEFQYGESKETWTAKNKARQRLQALGFHFDNNKVLIPESAHTPPTVVGPSNDRLIVGVSVGEGVVEVNKGGLGEKFSEAYALYPVRAKGPNAEERFKEQIKTESDFVDLLQSIKHYCEHLARPENSWRKPKQTFSAYLGTKASGFFWRDWINPGAGKSTLNQNQRTTVDWDPMTAPLER